MIRADGGIAPATKQKSQPQWLACLVDQTLRISNLRFLEGLQEIQAFLVNLMSETKDTEHFSMSEGNAPHQIYAFLPMPPWQYIKLLRSHSPRNPFPFPRELV